MTSTVSMVAIIGAGAMGSGIAQVAARAGHQVLVVDASEGALERSAAGIKSDLARQVDRGRMTAEDKDALKARLRWTAALADAAPAGVVIEAIIEDAAAKGGLFSAVAGIVAPDAIIASNTSSLSIADLAEGVAHPERFIGLHFFNPVPVMKLVEVVPGPRTRDDVTQAMLALMAQWKKVGVQVLDVPGFIVNRVARPYYAEGFAALGEGVDAAVIDRALEGAGGFRMGPLALSDMIGHDVNYTVAVSVHDAYDGATRFRPQPAQRALFETGRLGRKSGRGVYDYGASMPEAARVAPGAMPQRVAIAADSPLLEGLVGLVRQGAWDVAVDPGLPSNSLRVDGVTVGLGDGRPLAARHGVDVLLDHARDFAATPVLVVTARDDSSAEAVAGLAAAIGKDVLAMPDRPGQIVLRTLAQLANAAADAVSDGVASADDIDTAMKFGANHPEGPLAWAGRIGNGTVGAVLSNIAEAADDAMYRPAGLFRAAAKASA